MTSTVKGITVWVTRDQEIGRYEVWEQMPYWDLNFGWWHKGRRAVWHGDADELKRHGVLPHDSLDKGGPTAIMKATLYCALEWDE